MRRPSAILGTLVFLFVAPGFVAGVVPWWITRWRFQPIPLNISLLRWIGAVLLLIGAAIVLDSFARFALQGLGTPAPVLPTKHLVITGLYRYVRNPMYVGVAGAIFGQALMFGAKNCCSMECWSGWHSTCLFTSTKNPRCARPLARNMTSSAARSRAGYHVQGERLLRSPRGKAEVHQRETEPQQFHVFSASLRPLY